MLRYFITSILFLLLANISFAQQAPPPEEVEEEEPVKKVVVDSAHQLRLGFDVSRLLFNQQQRTNEKRVSYELELDYFLKNDMYLVAEGGWGNATLSYPDLTYESSNLFFRGGINKSLLPRLGQKDWDMAFIGLRYGLGLIERSNATYTVTDSTWGMFSGTVPAERLNAHWIEITGGVRVEIVKQLFLGWNVRGKFLVNAKKFRELPPYNIAGYGKGEKNTIFDFNVSLSYAIRWAKKQPAKPADNP